MSGASGGQSGLECGLRREGGGGLSMDYFFAYSSVLFVGMLVLVTLMIYAESQNLRNWKVTSVKTNTSVDISGFGKEISESTDFIAWG